MDEFPTQGKLGQLVDNPEYWVCENCGLILPDEKERAEIQRRYQPIKWKCKRCGGWVNKSEIKH